MLNVESSNMNYTVFNCVSQHQNQTNYLSIRLLSQSQTVVKPNESNWLITFDTPYTTSLTAAHHIKKRSNVQQLQASICLFYARSFSDLSGLRYRACVKPYPLPFASA